jgi:hypothetical protein
VRRASGFSPETKQNVIVIATETPRKHLVQEIMDRAAPFSKRGLFPSSIGDIGVSFLEEQLPSADVPLLTDDFAPTDNLLQ